jgi:hypothetical protein
MELVAAVHDFARQSDFVRFIQGQRSMFQTAARNAGEDAGSAAELLRLYARVAVGKRNVRLVLGRVDGTSLCVAGRLAGNNPPRLPTLLRWNLERERSPADILVDLGLAQGLFGPGVRPDVEEQIVRAAFVRIETLRNGPAAGRDALGSEVARGNTLVPLLVERLQDYEHRRAEIASLREYLPRLLAGLPVSAHRAAPDAGPARNSQCQAV